MFSKIIKGFRNTLGMKLTFWYSSIFILSSLFLIIFYTFSFTYKKKDRNQIRRMVQKYQAFYKKRGQKGLIARIKEDMEKLEDSPFLIRLISPQKKLLYSLVPDEGENKFNLKLLDRVSLRKRWIFLPEREDEEVLEVLSVPFPDGSLLQVGKNTEEREERMEELSQFFPWIFVSTVLVGLVGGVFLSFRALAPLRQFNQTIQNIIQTGGMDSRLPVRGSGDELDSLGTLVNQMLSQVEKLLLGMRQSLDYVAHDLKTPMTRWRSRAERAIQRGDSLACRESLSDCLVESDHILTLLNTLMDISEAEMGALKLRKEPVSLQTLAKKIVDLYSLVAEEKNIQLTISISPGTILQADPGRLSQCLANLLDNGLKYTPAGGSVHIAGRMEKETVVLSIKDTGIGIPPLELPKIWDRLYRCDQSRSQKGWGLGLSLVKAVIEAHGGSITVESELGEGTAFRVELPL